MKAAVEPSYPIVESPSGARHTLLRFVLPLLVATLLIGVIGAFAYWQLSDNVRDETDRTLAVIAEQKRQQIESLLAEPRLEAELYLSGNALLPMLFDQWLAGGQQDGALLEQMRDRIADVVRVRGWGGIAILDAMARPLLVVGEADTRGLEALAREILSHPRIELVDLHRNAQGEPEYGVLAPIGFAGATPLGLAYLAWRADRSLYPRVESWPVPTLTAETYLVRRDGDQVRFLTPLRHRPDAELSLTLPLTSPDLPAAQAAQGRRGIVAGGRDYRGVPVLAYSSPVGGTPWSMVAEIDESEAYAGIRATAWTTAFVAGWMLLLLYLAAYVLWRGELSALRVQQSAEARFRAVFEQAPLGVVLVESLSGRIIEANPRFAAIVGRAPSELEKLDWMRVTHPDDLRRDLDNMARLNAGEVSDFRSSKRYIRPDGSVVWVNLTVARAKLATDRVDRHLAIIEDITDRKKAQEALAQSEELLRLFIDRAPAALAMFDHEMRYLAASRRWIEDFSLNGLEILGRSHYEIFPEILPSWKDVHRRGLAGEVIRAEEDRFERSDGTVQWLRWEVRPWNKVDGSVAGIVIFSEDITLRKQAEEALRVVLAERSRKEERRRLLQDMHDGFGSQLASARLRIERSELTSNEIQVLLRECLDDLQLVVDTASDEDKTLRDALVDYRFRCESRLSEQPVRIDWDIQLDDCPPLGQRVNLHILRILQEALNNALKHARARHILVQSVYDPEGDLTLAVSDDGIGLPETLEPGRGTGNMQSRARNIGARLVWIRLESGTRVSLTFLASRDESPSS
jgi:PAS domain S-box-containing protein